VARARRKGAYIEILTHPAMARLHPTPAGHPESQSRLTCLLETLPAWREAEPATRRDLERVHPPSYLDLLEQLEAPFWLDLDTIATPTSYEAALLAVGHAIEAVRSGGFALVRPPGHHALTATAMGFCLINNVAVATRYAQAELGIERVAIVDWDVHHGNGTQSIFWDDDGVLYVSMHAWPFYPGTGGPDEQRDTTVNIPLAIGSGDDHALSAFERIAIPAVEAFAPELVIVSVGYDAHIDDPIGPLTLSDDAFFELSRQSAALAPRCAAVWEGGYNLQSLPRLVQLSVEGFDAGAAEASSRSPGGEDRTADRSK
jgi:acetoin utilization deacetylase AcuC-like enzyme